MSCTAIVHICWHKPLFLMKMIRWWRFFCFDFLTSDQWGLMWKAHCLDNRVHEAIASELRGIRFLAKRNVAQCCIDAINPTDSWLGGGFKYIVFSPLFGEDDPIWLCFNIFQMGWNNQIVWYLDDISLSTISGWFLIYFHPWLISISSMVVSLYKSLKSLKENHHGRMIRPGYFCVAWEFQQNVRWGASIIRALAAKRLGVLAAQAMEIPWDSNGGILVKDIENMQKRFYKSFFLAVYRVHGHLMSCVGANKAGRSLPSRAGHSDGTRVKARSIRNSQTLGPFEGLWKGLKQGRMQTLRTGRNHKSNLLTRVSIEGQFQDPSKIIRRANGKLSMLTLMFCRIPACCSQHPSIWQQFAHGLHGWRLFGKDV